MGRRFARGLMQRIIGRASVGRRVLRGISQWKREGRMVGGDSREFKSADADVLMVADFHAERYAAFVRLAVSLCLIGFLSAIVSFAVGRINNWLVAVCIINLLLAVLGIYVSRRGMFRSWFPWMTGAGDAFFVFGVAWFGPWLHILPSGSAFALVSQWAVFLILAIEAIRAQAKTILFQTVLICGLLSALVWLPIAEWNPPFHGFEQLFSDSANLTRIAIIMLSGLVLALGARRSRNGLKGAIVAARERSALQRFHPAEIKNQIIAGDIEALRHGSRHRVCILFADLRSFTSLSEYLPPEQVVKLLNSFRSRSEKVIKRHGGVIDKFIGDGFLAVFGLMEPRPHDAKNAVAAAHSMLQEIQRWSEKRSREGRTPLAVGVGLHSGDAFVGILGTARMEFTVIGDAVNVAQRLEAMTGEAGCSIMASKTILTGANVDYGDDGTWKSFPNLSLRGRVGSLAAYGHFDT